MSLYSDKGVVVLAGCLINESVRKYEKQTLEILYEKDQDFIGYQQFHTSQNLYHLWKVPSTAIELKLIHFIIKSLTLVPQNIQQMCSYCGEAFKDVFLHIVTSCQITLEIRNIFFGICRGLFHTSV